jgi:hypothetical protein
MNGFTMVIFIFCLSYVWKMVIYFCTRDWAADADVSHGQSLCQLTKLMLGPEVVHHKHKSLICVTDAQTQIEFWECSIG